MVLDHFRHQAADRTADAGDQMHDAVTPRVFLKGPLHRLDLTFDTPDARQELLFVSGRVARLDGWANGFRRMPRPRMLGVRDR